MPCYPVMKTEGGPLEQEVLRTLAAAWLGFNWLPILHSYFCLIIKLRKTSFSLCK